MCFQRPWPILFLAEPEQIKNIMWFYFYLILSAFDFFCFNVCKFLVTAIKDYSIVAYIYISQITYAFLSAFNRFSSLPNSILVRMYKYDNYRYI